MSRYRLVYVSNKTGTLESVTFLEPDDERPAEDFCRRGEDVKLDVLLETDLPLPGRIGHTFSRQ